MVLKYFTGKPCKRGHIAERYVSTQNCVECIAELRKEWVAKNPGRRRKTNKEWMQANPERMAAARRRFREKNIERVTAKTKAWKQENMDKVRASNMKRRAARLSSSPVWDTELTAFVAAEASALASIRTKANDVAWHVDHIVPLQGKNVCGLHVWNNLQVIPATQNIKKKNRWDDWLPPKNNNEERKAYGA